MKDKKLMIGLAFISLLSIVLFVFYGVNANNMDFMLKLRIPQVVAFVLTAIAIGFSTTVFQTISNNRILTPSIMGFDSLYLFLQTIIVFFLGSHHVLIANKQLNFVLMTVIMVGASLLLYRAVLRKGKNNLMFLLLLGTILSSLFRSTSSFLHVIIDPNEFETIQSQMFASFNHINTDILFIALIVCILMLPFLADDIKYYDVAALGRDHAINLGVDYDRFVHKSFVFISIFVSISTALVGPIAFLGLLTVNLSRERLKGYRHRDILITSSLLGIIALVGGQFIVEQVFQLNATLGVIINFFGGIYFITLLLKENRL